MTMTAADCTYSASIPEADFWGVLDLLFVVRPISRGKRLAYLWQGRCSKPRGHDLNDAPAQPEETQQSSIVEFVALAWSYSATIQRSLIFSCDIGHALRAFHDVRHVWLASLGNRRRQSCLLTSISTYYGPQKNVGV